MTALNPVKIMPPSPQRYLNRLLRRLRPSTKEHRMRLIRFYSAHIRQGDLCFDVGANVGEFTSVFLHCGARVVAIEPQPSCVAILRQRYATNQNVILVDQALGSRHGEAEIFLSHSDTVASMSKEWIQRVQNSGRFATYRWDRSCRVPVSTLDHLISVYGQPNYIKIDVEGYEYEVIKGLTQKVPLLSFEFVPENLEIALQSIGYLNQIGVTRFNHSMDRYRCLAMKQWVNVESALQYYDQWVKEGNPRTTDIFASSIT